LHVTHELVTIFVRFFSPYTSFRLKIVDTRFASRISVFVRICPIETFLNFSFGIRWTFWKMWTKCTNDRLQLQVEKLVTIMSNPLVRFWNVTFTFEIFFTFKWIFLNENNNTHLKINFTLVKSSYQIESYCYWIPRCCTQSPYLQQLNIQGRS
jgi:hypothetical protein